jgi:hypothetical protein
MRLIKQENMMKEHTFTPKIMKQELIDSKFIIKNGEPLEVLSAGPSRHVSDFRSVSGGRNTMPLSLNFSD